MKRATSIRSSRTRTSMRFRQSASSTIPCTTIAMRSIDTSRSPKPTWNEREYESTAKQTKLYESIYSRGPPRCLVRDADSVEKGRLVGSKDLRRRHCSRVRRRRTWHLYRRHDGRVLRAGL